MNRLRLFREILEPGADGLFRASRRGLDEGSVGSFYRYRFSVPSGAQELRIRVAHSPKAIEGRPAHEEPIRRALRDYCEGFNEGFPFEDAVDQVYSWCAPLRNILRVFVTDPEGRCLGEGAQDYGREWNEFFISPDRASPGLHRAGAMAGEWTVEIQIGSVLTLAMGFDLEISIMTRSTSEKASNRLPAKNGSVSMKRNSEGGWLKGHLHVHSNHSDGKAAPEELCRLLAERGFDFFALTDHNTVTGWEEMDAEPALTLIGGIEMGAFAGHALGLGIDGHIDWRSSDGELRPVNDLADEVHARGGVFGVAHPFVIDYPVCAQCRWEYEDTDYRRVDFIEVWGHPFGERIHEMRKTLDFWDSQLDRGYRISGTASIDLHDPERPAGSEAFPYNVIHVGENSERALVEALRQGDFYMSNRAALDLEIDPDGRRVMPGGTLRRSGDEGCPELRVRIGIDDNGHPLPDGCYMRIVASRGIAETFSLPVNSWHTMPLPQAVRNADWLRFEFFSDRECGRPMALSNPVYLE